MSASENLVTEETAAMVVIGDEILSGKVTDENSPYLARELRSAGVLLERVAVIPDEIDVIGETVAGFSAVYDYVFTSGGVGPTHDDLTMDGIARAFDVSIVEHPELRRAIEQAAGGNPSAAFLKMARLPEGAELVGTAGGSFPTVLVRNVFVLPGIPELFRKKIDRIKERFRSAPYHLRQVYVSAYETTIAEFLEATLAEYPKLLLGSYPKVADEQYRVRLTLESKDPAYVDAALNDLVRRMPDEMIMKVER